MTTPLHNISSALYASRVTLPDGRISSIGAVLDEAGRARGKAIAHAFKVLPKLLRRCRTQLAALFAPALGRTRQLGYLP